MAVVGMVWAVVIGVFASGCAPEKSPPAAPAQKQEEVPDQEGWNSTITATKHGRLAAVIRYGHMRRFADRREIEFDEGIEVDFYNTKGEHTSKLVAERGLFDEKSENVEAIGNVVVVSDSGITLRTKRLRWDRYDEKIMTDEFVTITTAEGDTLYGRGFESDLNLTHWVVHKTSGVTRKRVILDPRRKRRAAADTLRPPSEAKQDSIPVLRPAAEPDTARKRPPDRENSP